VQLLFKNILYSLFFAGDTRVIIRNRSIKIATVDFIVKIGLPPSNNPSFLTFA